MGNSLSGGQKFFGVLFAVAFILAACAAVFLVSLDRTFLDPATYKNAAVDQGAYDRLPHALAAQLLSSLNFDPCSTNPLLCSGVNQAVKDCARSSLGENRFSALSTSASRPTDAESGELQACVSQYQPDLQASAAASTTSPNLFKSMKLEDMQAVVSAVLPPAQMQAQAESFIDAIFPYLNGQQESIHLDFTSLKTSFSSPAGLEAVVQVIRSQPVCTFQQLAQMAITAVTGQGDLLLCRPSDQILNTLKPIIQLQINLVVSIFPDTLNFSPLGSGRTSIIRLVLLAVRLSPELPLFLLILITLAVVRSFKGLLYWWGVPLFSAGLLILVIGVLASVLFEPAWQHLVLIHLPLRAAGEMVSLLHDLLKAVTQSYLTNIFVGGVLLAFTGLLMWLGSAFLRRNSR